MALTADRQGRIAAVILEEYDDFPLAADAVVFVGGCYSFDTNGYLAVVADSAAQADKQIVYALAAADNTGGANGAKTVRCMTRGTILIPTGSLTIADQGKVIHATSDNVFALTSTNGRSVGPMTRFGTSLCHVQLG